MQISRRHSFVAVPAGLAALSPPRAAGPIDRHSLVRRHNPILRAPDPLSPLSVGNGEFAFTADITGLQTIPEFHEKGIPLCTQSQWGWHSFPAPGGKSPEDLRPALYDTYGRQVGYPTNSVGQARPDTDLQAFSTRSFGEFQRRYLFLRKDSTPIMVTTTP